MLPNHPLPGNDKERTKLWRGAKECIKVETVILKLDEVLPEMENSGCPREGWWL